jgi:hypothetical protein
MNDPNENSYDPDAEEVKRHVLERRSKYHCAAIRAYVTRVGGPEAEEESSDWEEGLRLTLRLANRAAYLFSRRRVEWGDEYEPYVISAMEGLIGHYAFGKKDIESLSETLLLLADLTYEIAREDTEYAYEIWKKRKGESK